VVGMRCLVVASEVGGRGGVSGGWVVRSCSGVWVGVVGAIELAGVPEKCHK
jgi:hypothetical protein